jgi:membrane associated rhomboid family serine protease
MIPIRDEDNKSGTLPFISYTLIAVNILVFLVELSSSYTFIINWSFIPIRFLSDPLRDSATLLTSMFMHGGWLHLGGNMLYLWVFGNNVEDRFGHLNFLVFYLVSGVAATFTQLWFNLDSRIPNLGASGAIAGVLGAYLLLFPRNWVTVLIIRFVTRLPAFVVLGFWFILQFFSGVGSIAVTSDTGGVAYMAHIGGFVAGIILAILFRGVNPMRG